MISTVITPQTMKTEISIKLYVSAFYSVGSILFSDVKFIKYATAHRKEGTARAGR